jgi:hypothetical protein
MAMTLYQRSYAKKLTGSAQSSYIQSVYDTYSHQATGGDSGATSKWRGQKTREKLNVHAYTRKLTVLNGSPA